MAIVNMSKFHLTLRAKDKDALLKKLQDFEYVHFNDLTKQEVYHKEGLYLVDTLTEQSELMEEKTRVAEDISILLQYEGEKTFQEKMNSALDTYSNEEALSLVEKKDMNLLRKEIISLEEKKKNILLEMEKEEEHIKDLSHWKNLSSTLEDTRKIKKLHFLLGTIPLRWSEELRSFFSTKTSVGHVEFLSKDERFNYVMILHGDDPKIEEFLRDVNFVAKDLEGNGKVADQIFSLKEKNKQRKVAIQEIEERLKGICKEDLIRFKVQYELLSNQLQLLKANDRFVATKHLDLMEGYVPTEKEGAFQKILSEELSEDSYILQMKPAAKDDKDTPIILKNHPIAQPFEDIVRTYALPSYNELDPTPFIVPWFMIYFGMMLGDYGYGLLIFLGSLILLKSFRLSSSMKRSLTFFFILSIPTIVFGMLFGSFFGFSVPVPILTILDPQKDYMLLMGVSVGLGVINILVGLALSAVNYIRKGEPMGAFSQVFLWYVVLIGLIVYMAGGFISLDEGIRKIAFYIALAGMVGIVLFSRYNEKGFGRYAWGLYDLYGISSYVGDFVSYTRIVALLLSGSFIGFAVNTIADMVRGTGVLGVIPAVIILVVFHLFNVFLSGLSGYVHTMRLVYVEYFGKFYEGEGVPFQGLRSEANYIQIK